MNKRITVKLTANFRSDTMEARSMFGLDMTYSKWGKKKQTLN